MPEYYFYTSPEKNRVTVVGIKGQESWLYCSLSLFFLTLRSYHLKKSCLEVSSAGKYWEVKCNNLSLTTLWTQISKQNIWDNIHQIIQIGTFKCHKKQATCKISLILRGEKQVRHLSWVVKREHTHIYFREALKINMQTEDTYLSQQSLSSQDHGLKTINFNAHVRINRSEIYQKNKIDQYIL